MSYDWLMTVILISDWCRFVAQHVKNQDRYNKVPPLLIG